MDDIATFPVDFVITWVDGDDPLWQKKRALALGENSPEAEANDASRFDNSDELRFAVRSLLKYCPWLRKIFIVTDEQTPQWLDRECDKVSIVDHKDIFHGKGTLPTFNSNVIEARLHHIPGLSEHYVTMNDDCFIGRPLDRAFFFRRNGEPKLFLSKEYLPERMEESITIESLQRQPLYLSTLNQTRKLIYEKTGMLPLRSPRHTLKPFTKSAVSQVEQAFQGEIDKHLHNQFRVREGIYFLALCQLYMVTRGFKVTEIGYHPLRTTKHTLSYLDYIKITIGDKGFAKSLEYALIKLLRPAFICFNDTPKTTDAGKEKMIRFLKSYYSKSSEAEL